MSCYCVYKARNGERQTKSFADRIELLAFMKAMNGCHVSMSSNPIQDAIRDKEKKEME